MRDMADAAQTEQRRLSGTQIWALIAGMGGISDS